MIASCTVQTAEIVGRRVSPASGPSRVTPLSVRSGPATLSAPEAGSLVKRVAESRDRQAFAVLFAYYFPRVKSYLLRVGASPGAAEELAQETMLRMWRKAESFNPDIATASTWVFVIARNLRIDRLRGEKRHPDPDPSEEPDLPASGETILISHERREKVRVALAALSSEQARIIELFYFEDLPHSEIARILGVPLGTVKSRIRLAVQRLRTELEEVGS